MRLILTLIIIVLHNICFSQEKEQIIIPNISKELVIFIDSLDKIEQNHEALSVKELFTWWSDIISINDNDNYSNYLKYQTKDIKSVHGLRFLAYYNNNFENSIDVDEDFSYTTRIYTGLEWEILRNGFLNSINKAKKSKIDNEINEIQHNREILQKQQQLGNIIITRSFNSLKKDLLLKRLKIETKINYLYRLLSYEKYFTKENVINRLEEKYSTIDQLKNIISHDSLYSSLKDFPLLLIDIDSINYYCNNNTNDSVLLASKIKSINTSNYIFENWSLKPSFKYNYLNRTDGSVKNYSSVGISLSLPISTGNNSRKAVKYQISSLEQNNYIIQSQKNGKIQSLISNAITYNDQLLKAIREREILEIRINSIRNRINISPSTISGVEFLELLSAELKTEILILDINKNIYENILNLSIALDGRNPSLFCKIINQNSIYKRNYNQRYVYVWSDFVEKTSASKLYSYLQEADIQNVLISFNNGENSHEYLQYLNNKDINTILLIGNNSILDKDSTYIRNYLKEKIKLAIKAINLDIEPHAVEKWKNKKQEYYNKLIEIYSIAKEECDLENKTLTVSIPVFYNEDFLTRIKPLCDKVFVMAYGSSNPNVIIKNIEQELKIIGTNSLVIVLSNKDFESAIERELVIDAIINDTKCQNIGYHKAATLFYINN